MSVFKILTSAILLSTASSGVAFAQSADSGVMMSKEIMDRLDRQEALGSAASLPPLTVAEPELVVMTAIEGVNLPAVDGQEPPMAADEAMAMAMAEYVNLPEEARIGFRIQFALNSVRLLSEAEPQLTQVCMALEERPNMDLRIFGHADTSGTAEHNRVLSAGRAAAVRDFIVNSCNIDGSRLFTFGLGEELPLPNVAGSNPSNRRVEFQLAG